MLTMFVSGGSPGMQAEPWGPGRQVLLHVNLTDGYKSSLDFLQIFKNDESL